MKYDSTGKVLHEYTKVKYFVTAKVRLLSYADEVQVEENQDCDHFNKPCRTLRAALKSRSVSHLNTSLKYPHGFNHTQKNQD